MRDACLIEQTSSGVACEHYATVLDRIFARDDIVLVAAGGLSCLRPLYFKALSLGKLEQCMFCMMSLGDYATGGAEKVLADTVRNAASRPCTRCVIIYVSCAEILSQCDFDAIERQGASRGVTIRALYRGPLTARRGNVLEQLDDILEKIPEGDSPRIAEEAFQLPPLPPDFSGIASLLQGWDAYPVLLTAGGCSSSVSISDVFNGTIRLDHSRFNDIEIARGCEQPAIAGISRAYQLQNHRLCCLLGSPVMEMTGFDFTGTQAELEALGIPTLHCPSDGFEPAQVGIARALLALAKRLLSDDVQEHPPFVNVMGCTSLGFGSRDILNNGTEILKSLGMQVRVWGEDSLECASSAGAALFNWVVAAEGMPAADYMKARFGTPAVVGIPLSGADSKLFCERAVVPGHGVRLLQSSRNPSPGSAKAVLIGQPLTIISLGNYLVENMDLTVDYALYAPTVALRDLFAPFTEGQQAVRIFSTFEQLEKLAVGADAVLADPLLLEVLRRAGSKSQLIELPDSMVGGSHSLLTDSVIETAVRALCYSLKR